MRPGLSGDDLLPQQSVMDRFIRFCFDCKAIVFGVFLFVAAWGVITAPFGWHLEFLPRDPVPADAIPDIGENQQIVFTEWMGRSPQDVDNQITYPLTMALTGIPGVKNIRSFSMLGFSTIYLIFNDDVDFYWARSRVLEKLNSLSAGVLPSGVKPNLGPDATALGQIFWYTLEGRNPDGGPAGGWDLNELRTLQDWYVRYALLSVEGVSEVASVGGFVQEYQVDVDPDLMRTNNVSLGEVVGAVKNANIDVGADTVEINKVEYVIRGVGFIKSLEDLRQSIVKTNNGIPVLLEHVAHVSLGPAVRRGALDKGGAEAVGGVVVSRYGANPQAIIEKVKQRIREIAPGLPRKTLPDGSVSQVRIVPFYDRSGLIRETLQTLESALTLEVLVTVLVVIVMMKDLASSLLISGLLPLAVLLCFVAMKIFGVQANIVALSGIAIAIGTMVDMGIVIVENIQRHLAAASPDADTKRTVFQATREVASPVLTAISTTVVGFLPVFAMGGAEGKLFRPLAFTKTFALVASIIVALTIIPPVAHALVSRPSVRSKRMWIIHEGLIYAGILLAIWVHWALGLLLCLVGLYHLIKPRLSERLKPWLPNLVNLAAILGVAVLLARLWVPLGLGRGMILNFAFVALVMGGSLAFFHLFRRSYPRLLAWCLDHKRLFLSIPSCMVLLGAFVWFGYPRLLGWLPGSLTQGPLAPLARQFPGLGKEFMPPLDEGSYLFMPVTMPHASIGTAMDILRKQDLRLRTIPEVESAVGKIGRVESSLDPAPVSMIETVINYHPEFLSDDQGRVLYFHFDPEGIDWFRDRTGRPMPAADGRPYLVQGTFLRDKSGGLIEEPRGKPFRLWRPALQPSLNPGREPWPGIQRLDDIWKEIIRVTQVPGVTTAPRLQPISARIVMLQSGINASMGVKISGPNLEAIQETALEMEKLLRQVPGVHPDTVIADRIIGKPYLEIHINRRAAAQYGATVQEIQDIVETAIGGRLITTTVEGRERYSVRVRYLRERRDELESLGRVLVSTPLATQIPLSQVADLRFVRGPDMIKSEDTFLVGYVLFDKRPEYTEVDVVKQAQTFLRYKMESGGFHLRAGVSYRFVGNYENQVRAAKKLAVILPLSLLLIFIILYLQFKSASVSGLAFSGIAVAWSGGFIMMWLYGQPWFLDFELLGVNMRDLFHVHPINLSVAIWVGFLALFGIASDDGVIMATYLEGVFANSQPRTVHEIRKATIEASLKRVRPCLMTTATTILALLPVLTSTGRGADIMVPMSIPSFGGMVLQIATMLIVPVLYCALKERRLRAHPAQEEVRS
ncbi:MAG: efflux RND transporter permease subunit [Thermodesulfobacteriota bacterium]